MDVGVLAPNDDSVRLFVYVLNRLDARFVYEAYDEYREARRRRGAEGKSAAEAKEAELPPPPGEPDQERTKEAVD